MSEIQTEIQWIASLPHGYQQPVIASLERLRGKKSGSTADFNMEIGDELWYALFIKRADGIKQVMWKKVSQFADIQCPVCKLIKKGPSELRRCVEKHDREEGGVIDLSTLS